MALFPVFGVQASACFSEKRTWFTDYLRQNVNRLI